MKSTSQNSTPNNLEKSCLRCVLYLFCTFLDKNEKMINHHTERGTMDSHPCVQDLQHLRLGKPCRGLQILDTRMGFAHPVPNLVIDYFSHSCIKLCKIDIKHTPDATFHDCLALTFCGVICDLIPE